MAGEHQIARGHWQKERIRQALAIRPMRAVEICATLGDIKLKALRKHLNAMAETGELDTTPAGVAGTIYSLAGQARSKAEAVAARLRRAGHIQEPEPNVAVAIKELAPGHRRVSFGKGWKAEPTRRPDAVHRGACSLWNLYG